MLQRVLLKRTTLIQLRRATLSSLLFDSSTKLDESSVDGVHTMERLGDQWSISKIPNGGYMAAIVITAARRDIDFRDVLCVHGHYLAKGVPNERVEVRTRNLHVGRSFATVSAEFWQQDRLRSTYLMTFGDLGTSGGGDGAPTYTGPNALIAPDMPAPDGPDCLNASEVMRDLNGQGSDNSFSIYDNLQVRVPVNSPCAGLFLDPKAPKLGTEARAEGWMRFSDGRPPCLRSNALLLDAMFPPIINIQKSLWVPTLTMDFQFWGRPSQSCIDAGGWVRARMQTTVCQSGLLIEDGEIWDGVEDRLLGSSRQLAKFLPPAAVTKAAA